MLALLIISVFSFYQTVCLDIDCTEVRSDGNLYLAPSALKNCVDMYSTDTCKRMFNNGGGYTANLVMLAPVARSTLCYMVGPASAQIADPSGDQKRAAIAFCPLYCGYCCVAPANNCSNAPAPRLDCNTITDDMCDSILWRELIAKDCPRACGFCLLGGCVDIVPDCATQPTICSNAAMAEFTQVNCRRTCGLCDSNSTSTTAAPCPAVTSSVTSGSSSCRDRSDGCSLWNMNGFCASAFYTTDHKRDYCAATCGIC